MNTDDKRKNAGCILAKSSEQQAGKACCSFMYWLLF